MPVGHDLKFYLSFWGNGDFKKNRMGLFMLKFIAAIE